MSAPYFLITHCGDEDLVTVKAYEDFCYGDGVMYAPEKVALYAIPEGYHIVAIDSEQELRDNLERHNETVRANSNDADYLQTR